jgi:glycosyltransferase involved in cell wall biosynthesis
VNAVPSVALYCVWHMMTQRPHHLARSLAVLGHMVDIHSWRPFRFVGSAGVPLTESAKVHLRQLLPSRLEWFAPIKRFNASQLKGVVDGFGASKNDVHIYGCAPFRVPKTFPARLIYDCMDDWSDMNIDLDPGSEREICDAARRIWVVSRKLQEKLGSTYGRKVEYVPNAVEYEHFAGVPALKAARKRGRPVLGYVGAIYPWFDAPLVAEVAAKLKDWEIHLVGPVRLNADSQALLKRPNIRFLGQQPYNSLPEIMSVMDVAMIPFASSKLIEATSPIKLYEYLAAGLPVVATPMPEVMPFCLPGVAVCAGDATEFARHVQEMAGSHTVTKRQEIARQNSWVERFSRAMKPEFQSGG